MRGDASSVGLLGPTYALSGARVGTRFLTFFFLGALGAGAFVPLYAQEFVANGSFANGLNSWTQASWVGGSSFGTNSNGPTDASAASGSYAFAGGGAYNLLQQDVALTPGAAYRLSFLAASSADGASTFGILSLRQEALGNYNSASFDYRPSGAVFGSYTVDFVADVSTTGLWLRNDGGGFTAYDNVSITPIAGVANALNYSAAGGFTEITSVLSGGGKVTVQAGTGGLTLRGVNTYTGGTEVTGGRLFIAGGGTLGAPTGAVMVSGNGILDLRNQQTRTGTVTMSGQDARIVSGDPASPGSLVNNGGALEFGGGQLSVPLSGSGGLNVTGGGSLNSSNSYTGATTISSTVGWYGANTLYLDNASVLGAASGDLAVFGGTVSLQSNTITRSGHVVISGGRLHTGTLSKSGGSFDVQGGVVEATLAGSAGLTKSGTNTAIISANNVYTGGTAIGAGILQIGNGGTSGSVSGPITNNATLFFNRADDHTVGNNISGSGSLTKSGPGLITLTGSNSYIGGTTISSGVLRLGASGSMRFAAGGPGTNTAVTGPGSFVAEGSFVIDLTTASTAPGTTWQLVSASSVTFGGSFSVADFTESTPGIWSRLTNGAAYHFSENSGAVVASYVPSYDSWANVHGLDPQGNGAPSANPDGDMLPNAREYAVGSNPRAADIEPWRSSQEGTNVAFSWLQRTDGSVTYTLHERADLASGSWSASAVTVEQGSGPQPPAGYEWKRISLPAVGTRFFRVRATMPQRQSITFGALPARTAGLPPFTLDAVASSGLPVTYTSSNPAVATVSGSTVTIVGPGTAMIRASQAGNSVYSAAADVMQTLTVAPRLSLTVDAKDFGAVGDGVADDSTALQNALDYMAANMVTDGGACLVLPSGTYKITRRLNFIKASARSGQNQGITIRGAESQGPASTVIYSANTEGALYFDINDDAGFWYQFGVKVQDLQIQAGAADAGAAIEVKRMSAVDDVQSVVPLIKNVAVTTDTGAKYFRYGIVGRKVLLPEFTDVRVTGVRGGMLACIFLERNYSFTIDNCQLSGANTGIEATKGGEGNDIMHTTITDVNTGVNMHVDPFDYTGPSSLGGALYGCDISAWDAGVVIDHKGYFPINDNNFVSLGNSNSYRHLSLNKVHHVIVTDNNFIGATNQTGVRFASDGIVLSEDNTVAYNNFGGLNTAVRVTSGVTNTAILDNLPAAAPIAGTNNNPAFVRRGPPRAFRETATRTPVYGYQPGRVMVPWNEMAHGPVIKVTDYGANGLDALDDTAAIQSAANALRASLNSSGQGTLYFPAGLYRLSNRLDLAQGAGNWKKLTICGDGGQVSGIAATGAEGVFKIDCSQPVPIYVHGLRIDPQTSNQSTAIEVTQQNGTVNGSRSLLMQDVRLFTWGARYFSGGIKGTGVVRPLLQNVDMRCVENDNVSTFGIQFTGGYGFDWQGGNIQGKQTSGIIQSLGGEVNIRGPRFAMKGLVSLSVDAGRGSFSLNAAHIDSPVNLRLSNANNATVINTLTIAGPQNPAYTDAMTLYFQNCTNLSVRDNILAAAYLTPRPSNVFVQLASQPNACSGFDISGNMMIFNDGEGTGIKVPLGNLSGAIRENRFFRNSIADIVCEEPSTTISLLPQ